MPIASEDRGKGWERAWALVLAFLVAQTRIESGVHSTLEVTYGALVGALATLVVFQVFS